MLILLARVLFFSVLYIRVRLANSEDDKVIDICEKFVIIKLCAKIYDLSENHFYISIYQETGNEENAKIVAKILLEKPVKVQSSEIQEILEEAKMVLAPK